MPVGQVYRCPKIIGLRDLIKFQCWIIFAGGPILKLSTEIKGHRNRIFPDLPCAQTGAQRNDGNSHQVQNQYSSLSLKSRIICVPDGDGGIMQRGLLAVGHENMGAGRMEGVAENWRSMFATAVIAAAAAFICTTSIESAAAAEIDMSRVDQARRAPNVTVSQLRVPLQKSKTYDVGFPFNDLLVGSADLVDVVPLNSREIYVLGKKLGTTNISILNNEKRLVGLIDVEVGLDTGDIAAKIHAGAGSIGVRVSARGNKIILSGIAPDAATLDRMVGVASELVPEGGGVINTVSLASPQQLQLQVRILEASREASRELGLRWEMLGRRFQGRIGSIGKPEILNHRIESPVTAGTPLSIATSAITGNPQFGHMIANLVNTGNVNIDLFINALETRGLVRRLAEPNLIALSGDTADFLAGGEIPVPIPAALGQAPGIEYKPFGVRLTFTPTVLGNGLINLRLQPEVSELDPTSAVTIAGTTVPGLLTRRAKTTVELRDGQSFAIAGLLQSVTQRDIDQFPWIGSAPVIGPLFRSTAFQQRETELVVIVTPHLVKPTKPGALIESPLDGTVPSNDIDLFLLGKLERKKSRPAAVNQYIPAAGIISGPYGHILAAPISGGDPVATRPAPFAVMPSTVRVKD